MFEFSGIFSFEMSELLVL